MLPTLQPGELLLVDTLDPRVFGIHRGDIVVFQPPIQGYQGQSFVKRVVAIGGDDVTISGGYVFVDGDRLSAVAGTTPDTTFPDETDIRVPKGTVFVLGDNREESWDSRSYGTVPLTAVIGRVWLAL